MKIYAIKKNGKYVKDFSNGTEFVNLSNWRAVEKIMDKKAAIRIAQEYGRKNGSGYEVVEL